jgi:hypothetical protein
MKKTLFLVFSGVIVIFTIISICCAPIINGDIIDASSWKSANCKGLEDIYKLNKNEDNKKAKNFCNRKKAMYGLEYSSLILDVILGFICTALGLLHFFDVAKSFEKVTGIIGLASGIVGFVMTLVYICYSGYIFTNDSTKGFDSTYRSYTSGRYLLKLDKDGAFAEWDSSQSKYKCLFYESEKPDSIYTKYNDLGKRQYNYEKKRNYDIDSKYNDCKVSYNGLCASNEYFGETDVAKTHNNCPYLYLDSVSQTFENKYVFDRWVTTIIFSCFIAACCIGLAIFGFLLFKSDSSGI